MAYKCTLVDYFDVWGNPEDGWEVNNLSREDVFYMKHDFTDEDMIKKLVDIEYLNSDVKVENFDIWGDDGVFEVFKTDNNMPLFRVELEEIKPIATLCLSNWGGISIFEIDDYEEAVIYQWYDNAPEKVQYDYEYDEESDEMEPFFLVGETKYYFNEFMVV